MAACASTPQAPLTPEQHAAVVAAAQQAGYKVVMRGKYTVFCPTAPQTGSHMAPTCISESDFVAQLASQHARSTTAGRTTNQPPGPGPGAGH